MAHRAQDSEHRLVSRFVAARVTTALRDTPVVMVNGPRQCGKTTLVRDLVSGDREYLSLDDDIVLAAARRDPIGFVRGLDRATIDEVQRAPDLLRAIKRSVDDDRRPGRFLLTGSADILALPTVSESLAGRVEIATLLPLSRSETRGARPRFIEQAFAGRLVRAPESLVGEDLVQAACAGGYPEMLRRREPARRRAWARDYVRALLGRDVREIADVERLDQMPRLLQALAHHSGQLTNFTQIGGQLGLDDKTTRKYVGILEQLFLIHRLPAWSRNQLTRLVKASKLHFVDSGLLAMVSGLTVERVARDRKVVGPLLEAFVVGEIQKQQTWVDAQNTMSHYRDKDHDEIDVVLENDAGDLVGIEIKAAATVTTADFKGLHKLAAATGELFKLGVVLYDGNTTVPFGNRMFAAPVSCIWG